MNKAMKPSCIAKICVCAAVCALNAGAADFLVKEYGAKGDGVTFDTEAVQKAIDACAADGGGRVVLEKGVFLVKPIMLKSGVDLHIARNARLLGSGDWRDYPNRGNLRHVISENMPRARDAALITADEAHGISITGEGVIDGNGMSFVEELPKEKWGRWRYDRVGGFSQSPPRVVFFAGCSDVTVKDITMTNQPAGWSYMVHDCDRVVFDRCKVMADIHYPNNDGIHINCSRDVSISNCRVTVGDDAIIVRANSRSLHECKPSERVTVVNCQLRAYSNAIRLGWCRDGVMRDCTFSNITIHDSTRGINMWLLNKDGGSRTDYGVEKTLIENIVFNGIVMDRIHTFPITVVVAEPSDESCEAVRNVTFANVTARSYALPEFVGSVTHPLENFAFNGCRFIRSDALEVRPPWEKDRQPLMRGPAESVSGLSLNRSTTDGNPFYRCRNFTFNACSFDDMEPRKAFHKSVSDAVADVRSNLVARFLSPEGLLYDFEAELPTPADCRDGRPNAIGWKSPIENGPMFTGLYLDSICARAKKTGAPADLAFAQKLAAGLMRAASVSEVKAMVVRGFGTDGACHYPLGSEDQTLPWFFGLFAYWRSGIPSDAEKSAVAAKMREVADALVANDWGCPCDGAFKGQVRGAFMENELPFRGAAHSLFVLRAMWEVTGDDVWRRRYEEALGRRQKSTALTMLEVCGEGWETDIEKYPMADGMGMWIYVCAQGCLARLAELDPAHADYFKSGLARNAARARPAMATAVGFSNKIERPFKYANWRTGYSWRPQKTQKDAEEVAATGNSDILGHRRRFESRTMKRPLSAAAVCAFANVARGEVEKTICSYDYSQLNFCEFFLAEVAAVQLNY